MCRRGCQRKQVPDGHYLMENIHLVVIHRHCKENYT
ncbi:hypothetical protein AFERRID_00290 [Acidithiobacillus ferridurans]|uniref:Uncharacterized protein n=1 Tax=Acidithiobacillus ferridurans TaxID=1232575 RepID=A0A2Z6IE49_ACIFI|nr:hypothetical protein AFERRID_00290 [Acidithiobacillus ferridurans]